MKLQNFLMSVYLVPFSPVEMESDTVKTYSLKDLKSFRDMEECTAWLERAGYERWRKYYEDFSGLSLASLSNGSEGAIKIKVHRMREGHFGVDTTFCSGHLSTDELGSDIYGYDPHYISRMGYVVVSPEPLNIRRYLTENTRDYFYRLTRILEIMSSQIVGARIAVFGGAVRDIVAGVAPSDVDVYIYSVTGKPFSQSLFQRYIGRLKKAFGERLNRTVTFNRKPPVDSNYLSYGFFKMEFDGISLYISVDINAMVGMPLICDFTVNNLIYDYDDEELRLRCPSPYTVEQTVEHIQNREPIRLSQQCKYMSYRWDKMREWIYQMDGVYYEIQA